VGPIFRVFFNLSQIRGRREGCSPTRPRLGSTAPGRGGRASRTRPRLHPVLCSAGPMELALRGSVGSMAPTRSAAVGPMPQQPEESPPACYLASNPLAATLLPALARRRTELGHGGRELGQGRRRAAASSAMGTVGTRIDCRTSTSMCLEVEEDPKSGPTRQWWREG
jgi:hypothetical protein